MLERSTGARGGPGAWPGMAFLSLALLCSCTNPDQWIGDLWSHRSGTEPQASSPSFSLPSGIYNDTGMNVTISAPEPGATIYYTLDGSTPTTTSSSGPSPLTLSLPDGSTERLEAMAASIAHRPSAVAYATYYVDPVMRTWAGGGGTVAAEGLGSSALELGSPAGIFLSPSGDLYVADPDNDVVIRISGATVHIVAGTPLSAGFSPDGTPATSARLDHPSGVAVNSAGDVYIADTNNGVIRVVNNADGNLYTVAGGGSDVTAMNVPATSASLLEPSGLALDAAGRLYICDTIRDRVRRYDPSTGLIATIAGDGSAPGAPTATAGDGGPATAAQLAAPLNLWVSPSGYPIYIADSNDNRIRKVDSNGIITTVAGTGAIPGSLGDGGAANSACLNDPTGVAVDGWGNLYVADQWDYRVRKIRPDGTIWTVAGNGNNGFYQDDLPVSNPDVWLSSANGMAVDAQGRLYLTGSGRIRCVPAHP